MIWERRHGPVGTGIKSHMVAEGSHWRNLSCELAIVNNCIVFQVCLISVNNLQ
jgi:hypothetical protein